MTTTERTSREKAAEMVAAFDDGMLLDTWLVTHHRDVPRLARDYIALLDSVSGKQELIEAQRTQLARYREALGEISRHVSRKRVDLVLVRAMVQFALNGDAE